MSFETCNLIAKELQAAYRSEIERRLGELGWDKRDMEFPAWSPQKEEWLRLVEPFIPKEMNDEVWNELKTKLIPLLEAYREDRLTMERNERRADRHNRLSQLFSTLNRETPPLVSFEIGEFANYESSRSRTVTQELAFPEMIDALQWPIMNNMLEADTTADELEETFNSRRAEIDRLATEWRHKIHKQMVDTIPKPEGQILSPMLTPNKSDPFKTLPDEIKLLLRADSLFLVGSSSTKVFTYRDILRFTKSDSHSLMSLGYIKPEKPLDIKSISKFPLARGISQMLLKSMGCPDASYLELEGEWICGRCHDLELRTWAQMVEHYVQEKLLYFVVGADVRGMNITYHDVHDPALFTDRPMIKYMSRRALDEDCAQLRGQVRQCKLCAKRPILKDVRGPEGKVLKHLSDAHDIRNPKFGEHYGDPVAVAALNSLVGLSVHDLPDDDDDDDDDDDKPDDGGEMYDYAEYGMFDEEGDSGYDSDIAAWLGFGYDPAEWGG